MGTCSMTRRVTDEHGSALLITLVIASILGLLGLGYLTLAEAEAFRAREHYERHRSAQATRDVLSLAATWLDPGDSALRPPLEALELDQRRGDIDGDGQPDAACDGRMPESRVASLDALATGAERACGELDAPDILLSADGPAADFLAGVSASLGEGVVIERVAIAAPTRFDGKETGLATVAATVAIQRGPHRVARTSGVAVVRELASLGGPELLVAGGDVTIHDGARLRWGMVDAGGDLSLPAIDSPSFPRSGLPRIHDGRTPLDFAPGRIIDWNMRTLRREFVGTELLGGSVMTRGVKAEHVEAPEIPDPWLSLRAAGSLVVGGEQACEKSTERQPWPYEPRARMVSDDLSHLSCHLPVADPLLEGRARRLVDDQVNAVGAGAATRRFLLADAGDDGHEATWREDGTGPARTASEWLEDAGARPVLATFLAGESEIPALARIPAMSGLVIVEAERVELVGDAPRLGHVVMPGEPFFDDGIDRDGDGVPEPETIGDGRWNIDAEEGEEVAVLAAAHEDLVNGRPPDGDLEATTLDRGAHEPFLNLDYPATLDDPSVTAVFWPREGRPAGWDPEDDRETSVSRDEEGARLDSWLTHRGVVLAPVGSLVVGPNVKLFGALRARLDVEVRAGAQLMHDAALARTGWPAGIELPRRALVDVRVERGRWEERGRHVSREGRSGTPPELGEGRSRRRGE